MFDEKVFIGGCILNPKKVLKLRLKKPLKNKALWEVYGLCKKLFVKFGYVDMWELFLLCKKLKSPVMANYLAEMMSVYDNYRDCQRNKKEKNYFGIVNT